MRRPSALQMAENCGLASVLAERFPETSSAADFGTDRHEEIRDVLRGKRKAKSPEARAAIGWLDTLEGANLMIEEPIELRDPETDEVITAGTPDLVVLPVNDPSVIVVDWKTGRPENVPHPDNNLQVMSYAAAAALKYDRTVASGVLVFLDGDKATPVAGQPYPSLWDIIERVRRAAERKPVATPGAHCSGCWQRMHCDSWRARATTALALVQSPANDLTLTNETAAEMILRVQAVREAADTAEQLVRAHVLNGGTVEADGKVYAPAMVNGRRTGPTLAELEAAGLGHMIRPGTPTERWSWRRA